jgi:ankyrin repeat protein
MQAKLSIFIALAINFSNAINAGAELSSLSGLSNSFLANYRQTIRAERREMLEKNFHRLIEAAQTNNANKIKRLLKIKDIDINARDSNELTALHNAANESANHVLATLLESLIGRKININDTFGPEKRTALHETICRNNTDGANMLLQAGADVNAADIHGQSPLHYSVRYGCDNGYICKRTFALVRRLMEKKANPQAVDSDGKTPLMLLKELKEHGLQHRFFLSHSSVSRYLAPYEKLETILQQKSKGHVPAPRKGAPDTTTWRYYSIVGKTYIS